MAILAVAPWQLSAAEYIVRELAVLPPVASQIVGALNNRGLHVGGAITPGSTRHRAFLAGHHGVEEIEVRPGSEYSAARDINDAGEVVGSSNKGDAVSAFYWTPRGGAHYLPPLPGDSASEAFRINLSGQVVGYSSGARGMRAVLWSRGGAVHELPGVPKGRYSRALAINNRGDVVGSIGRTPEKRAFLWAQSGVKDLGALAGDAESEGLGINDAGDIVGWSRGARGTRAVMWSAGQVRDLGALEGASLNRARAINARGDVVGDSGHAHHSRAFVWTRTRGLRDLNKLIAASLHLVLQEAVAINEHGQIVAVGIAHDHGQHDAHRHTRAVPVRVYLLVPAH